MADGDPTHDVVGDAAGIAAARTLFQRARDHVEAIVLGKSDVVELALVAVIGGGHLLLEDVPGVGKTTLAGAMAGALGGTLSRIQFTSDLLPGDITGVNVLTQRAVGSGFGPGPYSPASYWRTRSTAPPPRPSLRFLRRERAPGHGGWCATRAPGPVRRPRHAESPTSTDVSAAGLAAGSFHDAAQHQLQEREHERAILRSGRERPLRRLRGWTPRARALHSAVGCVSVHAEIEDLLLEPFTGPAAMPGCCGAYRREVPRPSAAPARASTGPRAFVIPEDLHALAVPVLAHRVVSRSSGERAGDGAVQAIQELLWELPAPD